MKPIRKCSTEGCDRVHYGRGYCSACYWKHSKAGDLNAAQEVVAIPQPPKPPADKKRCRARMNDGSRCIRGIKAKGFCAAHWHEFEDRQSFELRDRPIDSNIHDCEGNEAALAEKYGSNSNV